MKLGEKIFELRKKCGLSQEQLGEKINVTRQTISNWELGETSPNPEQLKLLSKELNVSIDELLDNDIHSVLIEKVSNTEKLAGLVLRVLKCLGVIFIIVLIIDIASLILFTYVKDNKGGVDVNMTQEVELQCSMDEKDFIITIGSDGYFNCSNCSKELQKDLKDNYIDFGDIDKTTNNVIKYFKDNNGICD
ncbi:MAG: helix-turn-helix transcriptional regulator [Firmicutes bacterium]|nr:helix-turn-helix transcriptional regulator [Bacillota bacterium]